MRLNKPLFFLLILLFSVFWFNKSVAISKGDKDTTQNIVSYYDEWNLRFMINNKFNSINIQSNSLDHNVQWRTNDNNTVGVGANYKWAGLNLLFIIPGINNDEPIYGSTKSFNALFNVYTKRLGMDLFVQESKGFYLTQPNKWYPDWNTSINYPLNKSLQVNSLGGNFLYVLNPEKYSLRANFILNERQLKSAGSPIVGMYFNIFTFSTDSSILPISVVSEEEKRIDIREAAYLNLGWFGGYSHTFIIQENIFISLTGAVGLALQGSEISTKEEDYLNEDRRAINSKLNLRISIGYADDDYFLALSVLNDNNQLGQSLSYNFGLARITAGYRIKSKK